MKEIHGNWEGPPLALFWDQSLVWGLICLETLRKLAIPFQLLTGREIAQGHLAGYRVLLVPGGWASHKIKALGTTGREEISRFIEEGGSYLGFCGGAGLALSSHPSLCLVPLERMPLSERLPSASGQIWVQGNPQHPTWENLPPCLPVSIWWPSQFSGNHSRESSILATYVHAGENFMVADLPVVDLPLVSEEEGAIPWKEMEKLYGINLNPDRILGHPAIIEVKKGKGRLVLSYPHLETPGDTWGNYLFLNILKYLNKSASSCSSRSTLDGHVMTKMSRFPGPASLHSFRQSLEAADELIRFGENHLLWQWRKPWLLRWRRGIRGLEYGSLAVALKAIMDIGQRVAAGREIDTPWIEAATRLEHNVQEFCLQAKRLLLEEKLAGQAGSVSKLGKVNETVDRLRAELFGSKMNHGGLSRVLFDEIDAILLNLIRLDKC
ncbi:BPL-N domain-containing protein [Desulforhabdus amnigena]|uniref:Biotin-protein ligase N-terminal domain-containing protein n=1 Tax=Desulforhabdus amnigena TaxID=40218 RepID=A0A9W6D4H8_9BACT|nr:BPL-N domain-containing protein [Desulforhabdus amnigena]NLJ29315.1 hypothetical protein [Deltaproteobacteria bacterium]GLI34418.1 hypothetical protein DAMNIGENAA_18510 [Desulforhabdus amnigena]